MRWLRDLVGVVGLAGGVGLLVFGLQNDNDPTYLVGGAVALVVGLVATFRRVRCPGCHTLIWVSSKKLTRCMKCGVDWSRPPAASQETGSSAS